MGPPDGSRERQGDHALPQALSEANNDPVDLHRTLAKQQAQLTATNQRQSLTLSMVAHDLRNPLGLVIGFSEVLQRTLADCADAQDLLLLHRVAETHRSPASRKGIRIEVEVPAMPVVAQLDADRIEQVLDNLLTNAIKFTPRDRSATVLVRGRPDGDRLVLQVVDEGIGIEPDHLTALFQPFARSHRKGTDGERGTGLGLAICRSLVQAHDGTLSVSSAVDSGTTFTARLPLGGPAAGPAGRSRHPRG